MEAPSKNNPNLTNTFLFFTVHYFMHTFSMGHPFPPYFFSDYASSGTFDYNLKPASTSYLSIRQMVLADQIIT